MRTGTGSKTEGGGPRPVDTVVRIALKYATDPKKINWAASVALREARDLVREADPGWTVLARDIELVETDVQSWPGQALFRFKATPTKIPVKRRRR